MSPQDEEPIRNVFFYNKADKNTIEDACFAKCVSNYEGHKTF